MSLDKAQVVYPVCYSDKHFVNSSADFVLTFHLRIERKKYLKFYNIYHTTLTITVLLFPPKAFFNSFVSIESL